MSRHKNRNKPMPTTNEAGPDKATEPTATEMAEAGLLSDEVALPADPPRIPSLEEIMETGFNRDEAETMRAGMEIAARGPSQPSEDTSGLVAVQFHGNHMGYNSEDNASFEPHVAKGILKMEMVDGNGNRRPLATRYKKPVLERLGITKGDKPESKPVGGDKPEAPLGPNSNELVSKP